MRAFYRTLRIFAAVTLFFFCWTYMPIYAAVAYAATSQKTATGRQTTDSSGLRPARGKSQVAADFSPRDSNAAKFEKAVEDIREKVGKAEEKIGRGSAATEEIAVIKTKKAEVESLDGEFKKEFAATEKKLKDAKLPQEILNRHYNFVKHYEDNLKELKTNLAAIEKPGVTNTELRTALQKARLHLEKTKPPRKHVPLDPNNLPFQNRKAKAAKAPRLKKEEFEKDFPPQKRNKLAADERGLTRIETNWKEVAAGFSLRERSNNQKLVQLAYNDVATDAPFQLPRSAVGEGWGAGVTPHLEDFAFSPNYELPTTNLALASADAPTAEDLAETPEVQFTDAIRAKAQELSYSPVKIYEYVRNNIEYAPTYGSIQGADQCLQSQICNDMDTASLLIALLRASGIYAHYAYGTIEVPIDKAMNWVGGVTDPKMAGTVFATNGVPAMSLISGGTIKYVQVEHVWVKAFIDYIPSRGAVHKQGDTWISLDPSFKQYNYTQGIDITSAVPFDAQSFANQILSTATTNTTDGSVTNVNSAYVQQTMQDYQTQVQNYIQQNYPNATVGDVIGKKEIIQQNYPILLGTLPYKTVQVGSEFARVPDNLRETMSFSIPDPTGASAGLTYTTGMSQIAGKKLTLSFSAATSSDEAVLESFIPQLHADGSPIQTSELPNSLPAYLINLVPELRIDGQVVASGASGMMGGERPFVMSLNEPGIGLSNIDNIVNVGQYFVIGLDTGRISANRVQMLRDRLETTKEKLTTQNFGGLSKDDLVGDLLYGTIVSYFLELNVTDELVAKSRGIIRYRAPSVGMFSLSLSIKEFFGVPSSAEPQGMMMDVDRIEQVVFSKDGNLDEVKQYMLASGNKASTLEHSVPERLFGTTENPVHGISAVKALQIANDQGIPIYTVDQTNFSSILPKLQLDSGAIADIKNAVNAGKEVTVPQTVVNLNGWTGCGYVIIDPNTGAGAYMISGGMSGGFLPMWIAVLLLAALIYSVSILLVALALLILSFIALFYPVIVQYLLLVDLCGQEAANAFYICLAKMIGVDVLFRGVSSLVELIPKIGKAAGRVLEWIGIYYAIYELYECNKDLAKECN